MAAPGTGNKSLKDYLKKYESSDVVEKKKKKKQKKPSKPEPKGVLVVDEDPVWQKPVDPEEDENENDSAEERPLVDEDIDVKRMRRLEEIKARRAHNAIAEDGSGWVTLPLNREDTQSDLSPPRRQRTRNDSPSPEPGPRCSVADRVETDMSPPRRRKRHNSPSPEPNRKHTKPVSLDSDMSPPRKRKARNDSPSPEPEAKVPKNLSEDLSPPRRRHVHSPSRESSRYRSDSVELDDDLSPPRRKRDLHGSPVSDVKKKSNDLSPPRRRRYHSPSPEPGRRPSKFIASNADLSPPRRNMNMKGSRDSDLSPQRKTADPRRSSNIDSSPPRRPRRESPPPQTSKEQRKTGLISGKDIGSEYRKKKEDEQLRFKNMDSELTGQNAEAVFRDKITGKRISKEEYLKSKQKKVIEKPKEIKLEWGKGLAQKREAEARLQELELEKEKPFARTRDDPELDQMLKERVRFGDPMAHLVKKKRHEATLVDLGDDEEMKKSGFIIPQSVPKHSWLTRGLEAATNRYGIKPGRHWDGVDRSNGTEKKLIKTTNERKATEIEAYLWSVADM
ncbi:Bud13 [Arabidopsis thaliana x Arabidopsis arenosa]|uniref:Bud13 n=1 Tax=Arabidopsis thaliana x Arabidopsis arenosa TaxID=1240361 RepID=A0A8T2C708_9BRAS|nr:Bud13 [Arabidopsis thaliana x Arabidopsis arenosa]